MREFIFPGDERIADVNEVRARIAELADELDRIERAPIPAAELRAKLERAFLDDVARRQVEYLVGRFRRAGPLPALFRPDDDQKTVFALLVAIIGPGEAAERVMRFVGADVDDGRSVPTTERAARIAELRDELQKLTREEEIAILEAEKRIGDVIVLRREGVDSLEQLRAWSRALDVESRADSAGSGGS